MYFRIGRGRCTPTDVLGLASAFGEGRCLALVVSNIWTLPNLAPTRFRAAAGFAADPALRRPSPLF